MPHYLSLLTMHVYRTDHVNVIVIDCLRDNHPIVTHCRIQRVAGSADLHCSTSSDSWASGVLLRGSRIPDILEAWISR